MSIKIGTRGSKLALYQANLTRDLLIKAHPDLQVGLEIIKTTGDILSEQGARDFETKSIFTREIEEALLSGKIDLAVHSAKDMAVPSPEGLEISACLPREDFRDAYVHVKNISLEDLPKGSVIGTSALRRKHQLLKAYPHLTVKEIRGNVDTRLRKLEEGQYDGILLATAGLKRLELGERITQTLDPRVILPAPGQGIIAIQTRENDERVSTLLRPINDESSFESLQCERAFIAKLQAGCEVPCGLQAQRDGDVWHLNSVLFSGEGEQCVQAQTDYVGDPVSAGEKIAELLLEQGGSDLLKV